MANDKRERPTCPICGRKNLRSVGKHIKKEHGK